MKILILENFFNQNSERVIPAFRKFTDFYKIQKIKHLSRFLNRKYKEIKQIKVITASENRFHVNDNIKVELLSEFRISIDHDDFVKLKRKMIERNKIILIKLYNNLLKLRTFHIEGIFLGKILDYTFSYFYSKIFGEFELIHKLLLENSYDKVIFLNSNPDFIDFYKSINLEFKNVELYKDFIFDAIYRSTKLYFIKFFLGLISFSFKNYLLKKNNSKPHSTDSNLKNIIFVVNSRNQFNSIESIYQYFKKKENVSVFLYSDKFSIPFKNFNNLKRNSNQIRKIWLRNQDRILKNIRYDTIKLKRILKEFYSAIFYYFMIKLDNSLYHFKKFLEKNPPSLVIFADEMKQEPKIYAGFCKLKRIPTLYVSHAAVPVYDEIVTLSDFDYIMVPGQKGKDFLIQKGEPREKLFITGRSRYEDFYEGRVNTLHEIRDMYNNRIYKFSQDKFSILLTTNPVGYQSNEKIITSVVNSLKELNLLENLIIKLHPRENGIHHRIILKKLNVNPIIVQDYHILELIKSCDLLLSRTSTTILESMIIGTPVILLDNVNFELFFTGKYLFLKEEDLIKVEYDTQLTSFLRDLIENKRYYKDYSSKLKDSAKNYSYYNKQNSTSQIIIKLVNKIIKLK